MAFHQGPFERWVDPPDVVTSAGNQAGFGDENIVYKQRDGRKHFLLYSTQHYKTCKSRQNIIDFKSAIMSAPQAGKEDYVDKGLDSLEKKQGQDPNKLRSVNEKVTDKARGMFEKATGKNVPDKVSN
ncbi:hypothetical protein D6D19_01997 [Aureobasidium pullulans]|nr:hypothetical protein D6D27_02423 [Aureobasidium pullulans]THW02539.1 hypothetical protein D6D26_04221 [Aureobasidium pullulans]THW66838.1 hypothetical protein D6D20_00939 [Aureobasidium pullulans]THW77768.1 hypothetical protein D6D19_01997 [Aureobasidium pullulans]THW90792.1 hypothetical protein D6D18_06669 [Aureobasidium pullulans]